MVVGDWLVCVVLPADWLADGVVGSDWMDCVLVAD